MKVFAGKFTVEQEVFCANKSVSHKSTMAGLGNKELQMPPDVAELVTLVLLSPFLASSQFLMTPGENAPRSSTTSLSRGTTNTPLRRHLSTEMLGCM